MRKRQLEVGQTWERECQIRFSDRTRTVRRTIIEIRLKARPSGRDSVMFEEEGRRSAICYNAFHIWRKNAKLI